ncbi:hypothetical protein AVEN_85185-1 [Araneus ventricosus]|uniref:Uncharacterized protein n=1 Tax=Araneus ventricosus TaxID=182803 RepID=A0A4Y2NJ79_ARAVE|nr:hypothetical protein AVEN_85185-1 [Araneus ventricosus]
MLQHASWFLSFPDSAAAPPCGVKGKKRYCVVLVFTPTQLGQDQIVNSKYRRRVKRFEVP